MNLAPDTAIESKTARSGNPAQIGVGDLLRVKRARVPADGVAVESASVDRSMLSGESMPVDKSPVPR